MIKKPTHLCERLRKISNTIKREGRMMYSHVDKRLPRREYVQNTLQTEYKANEGQTTRAKPKHTLR